MIADRWRSFVGAVLLTAVTPLAAFAQAVVSGTVTSSVNGQPIVGAVIDLGGAAGKRSVVTGLKGTFRIAAVPAGSYTLTARYIGFAPSDVHVEAPASGEAMAPIAIALTPVPFALPEITARSRGKCERGTQPDGQFAALWDRLGVVAASARITVGDASLEQTLLTFERERRADGTSSPVAKQQIVQGNGLRTFVAAPPADLVENGYARIYADSAIYLAPDLATILSAEFRTSHCFARQPDTTVAGQRWSRIRFASGRRETDPIDISGTLLVSPADGALRSIQFEYAGLPKGDPELSGGGYVEFGELPWGGWVVAGWELRMPFFETRQHQSVTSWNSASGGAASTRIETDLKIVRTVQSGGYVVRIRHGQELFGGPVAVAPLTGVVFDSTTMRPLANARIAVEGTSRAANTDDAGAYTISDLLPGSYTVTARHPRLDLLYAVPREQRVTVGTARTSRADFVVPGLAALVADICPSRGRTARREATLFRGVLRDSVTRAPVPGARIRASYMDAIGAAGVDALRARNNEINATTDGSGVFWLCGVPTRSRATVTGEPQKGAPWTAVVRQDSAFVLGDVLVPASMP